jgi:cell division protein FtsB
MNFLLRKSGYVVIAAIVCIYALIAMRSPQGLPALLEKQRQVRELQVSNADAAHENEKKRKRIERLRSSRDEQGLEIRERLKLLRPGETQFILPDGPKPAEAVVGPVPEH